MRAIPWVFAAVTAVWFGILAHRSGHVRSLWAFMGGLFALVMATIVLGLFQATFLPVSQEAYTLLWVKDLVVTTVIVGFLGWLLTAGLHEQPQHLREAVRRKLGKDQDAPRPQGSDGR